MGLIVSRWASMLNFVAILILITASGCKMSSWSIPGMSWGGSKENTAEAQLPGQPADNNQAVPSTNASKYLTPPTISTGTPSYSGNSATAATNSPNGRTTAYTGRNTLGPYHPPKKKTVAVTPPQYAAPQYPATQYPATQYPATQYPATQYPATASQAPATQLPPAQYPATQYSATASQAPATQLPRAQYPATQYPATATQYPATKTADTRSATRGTAPATGNYQGGFYAPERPATGARQNPAVPTTQPAPNYSNPQNGAYGQGAANTYGPGRLPAKSSTALPATQFPTSGQAAPYASQDPYAGQSLAPVTPGASATGTATATPYRPGSTGRLDPTTVPQQQPAYPQQQQPGSYPQRSSEFSP
jgi:hypothetical protein